MYISYTYSSIFVTSIISYILDFYNIRWKYSFYKQNCIRLKYILYQLNHAIKNINDIKLYPELYRTKFIEAIIKNNNNLYKNISEN